MELAGVCFGVCACVSCGSSSTPATTAAPSGVTAPTSGTAPTPGTTPAPTPTPPTPTPTPGSGQALSAPIQISPNDGMIFTETFPRPMTFTWQPVAGAATYRVEVDCYHCCVADKWCEGLVPPVVQPINGVPISTNLPIYQATTTSYHINSWVGAQPGRWKVWAVDSQGREGLQSPWWQFDWCIPAGCSFPFPLPPPNPNPSPSSVLDQSFIPNPNTFSDILGTVNGTCCIAQTFTAGITGTLTDVQLLLTGFGTPLTIAIYDTVGGLPATSQGSVTVPNLLLTDTYYDFAGFNVAVVKGRTYAIVASWTANQFNWQGAFSAGATYGGGNRCRASGVERAWSCDSTVDLGFKTFVVGSN